MNFTRTFLAILAIMISMGLSSTALADTTVYANGGNFGWANTTNQNAATGAADGSGASMGNGGWLAFQTDTTFTTVDMTLDFISLTGTGTIRFYVGTTNNAGWFSNLTFITVTAVNGVFQINSPALTTYCTNIGGCNVFIVQNISGQTLVLDSADLSANLVAPSPEPSTWAMMILAFALIGWRLKAVRRSQFRGIADLRRPRFKTPAAWQGRAQALAA